MLVDPPITFEKYVDVIDVTSDLPKKDPKWNEPCPNGHPCDWGNIEWWVDEVYCCGRCEEDHEDGHWVCHECLVEVEPKMKGPSGYKETIPGMSHYRINGREVSPEEFARVLKEYKDGPE